jgi:ATP-dependent DNA helicase RecG
MKLGDKMNVNLKEVKGVGDKYVKIFRQKGLWNTYDLLSYAPKCYDNYIISDPHELKHLEVYTLKGIIIEKPQTIKRKVSLTTTFFEVEGFKFKLIIFGREYLDKQLNVGEEYIVKGQYNLFKNEINVQTITKGVNQKEIKPIYRIDGIPDTHISKIVEEIFKEEQVDIFETLPIDFLKKHFLYSRKKALKELHLPTSYETLQKAITRFKMEEALIEVLTYTTKFNPKKKRSKRLYNLEYVKHQIDQLPFQLTLDQQEAVNDIFRDYKRLESMYRLIQGDVGSGKTVVAFIAALGLISAGYQVAFMAPTELLARQHYQRFVELFSDVKTVLYTGSSKGKDSIEDEIMMNQTSMIFGTHALANKDLRFGNLGLVIIDEQHKFGVEVRQRLISKGDVVDVLYLTATPIPRSLFLTYFSQLDISIIKQKPNSRKTVETVLLSDKDALRVLEILKERQANFEQSFVVVPAIDTKKKAYTIETIFGMLETMFDHDHLYVIHGKMSQHDIDSVMDTFAKDPKGILLSTTMIEVGIDIKNATTMVIFGAEHFGLSQLHQLRGRIGRGDKMGTCYLLSPKNDLERLKFLEETQDGFILSDFDLKLRGPGIFSDYIQTGNLKLNFLDLTLDQDIIKMVRKDALEIYKNLDQYPYLKKRIV